jgi:hypothetical protein
MKGMRANEKRALQPLKTKLRFCVSAVLLRDVDGDLGCKNRTLRDRRWAYGFGNNLFDEGLLLPT